ncbi:MAG: hypothetical protein J6P87_09255 [Lachnospiraceae bacterium]|nr:hypothetical protein [Lachnospiraceae bacterium]
MIRTDIIKLSVIAAVAYRQKLASGGSGVTILRYDSEQPGIASISKTSGEAIPAKNTPADLYPAEAFDEAIALTSGMPYTKRGGVKLDKEKEKVKETKPEPIKELPEEDTEFEVVLDTGEYQKIVDAYTDKDGKLSYELLNRDLIRFAHQSSTVRQMLEDKEDIDVIRTYIITNKFRKICGNPDFTTAEALKAAELLDEVSPKSVFKELDAELRKSAGSNKRKK